MQRVVLLTLALVPTLAACTRSASPPADPEFTARWGALTEKGVEPFYVEQDHGEGLMGSVRRARSLPPAETRAPDTVPGLLPDAEVTRVIRGGLNAVKHCYLMEAQSGNAGSGKAIVTFKIASTGLVQEVRVDAPAFTRTRVPACLSGQIRSWQFPRFSGEPMTVSYPFLFVGG